MRTKAMIRLPAVLLEENAVDTEVTPVPCTAADWTSAIPFGVGVAVGVVVGVGVGVAVAVGVALGVGVGVGIGVCVGVEVGVALEVGVGVGAPCAPMNVATTALQLVAELSENVPAYVPVAATGSLSSAAR